MVPKPEACRSCVLYQDGKGFVPDEIRDDAVVQVHAQGPGSTEEAEGKPKVGPTGQLEETQFLPLVGLTRERVSLSNALRCRWIDESGKRTDKLPPPKILNSALETCHRSYFRVGASTKLVIAQGDPGWRSLGGQPPITAWRGHLMPPTSSGLPCHILGMLHPAALRHAPEYTHATVLDWQKVPCVLDGTWPRPLPSYRLITQSEFASGALDDWMQGAKAAPYILCDTEYGPGTPSTTSVLRLLGLGYPGMKWVYQQQWVQTTEPSWTRAYVIEMLRDLIKDKPFVCFNALGAELPVLEAAFGFTHEDFVGGIHDLMLAHAVLYSDFPHDFGFVASCYGWYQKVKHLQQQDELLYNCGDVAELEPMHEALQHELSQDPKLQALYQQALALLPILLRAHAAGIRTDTSKVRARIVDYTLRMDEASQLAQAGAGWPINVGSDDQLTYWCYGVQGYSVQRHRKTRRPTVDHDACQFLRQQIGPWFDAEEEERDGLSFTTCITRIEQGADPVLEARTAYATAQHTVSFYLEPMKVGRIYPEIHQHTQVSGRFSTINPPVAQFPADVLDLLIPDEGEVFIIFDWRQIEPRLRATLSEDTRTLAAFARGEDIYELACMDAFGRVTPQLRKFTKSNIILRTDYGGNARQTANVPGLKALNLTTADVSRAAVNYDSRHPEAVAWRTKTAAAAVKTRLSTTFMGRRRLLVGSSHEIAKEALNHPCQGGVRDIASKTMLDIAGMMPYARLVWDRHDEQCWGVPSRKCEEALSSIKECVEQEWMINQQRVRFPAKYRIITAP